jgi:surfactin synthase thioesterase subunit
VPAVLPCPILEFGGPDDPEVVATSLESCALVAGGGFELRLFQGGRFFMHSQHGRVVEVVWTACDCLRDAS